MGGTEIEVNPRASFDHHDHRVRLSLPRSCDRFATPDPLTMRFCIQSSLFQHPTHFWAYFSSVFSSIHHTPRKVKIILIILIIPPKSITVCIVIARSRDKLVSTHSTAPIQLVAVSGLELFFPFGGMLLYLYNYSFIISHFCVDDGGVKRRAFPNDARQKS